MAATGKAPWTMYVVALLALGVSTATSMMVQVRERRGTGQHNATLASTLTQVSISAWATSNATQSGGGVYFKLCGMSTDTFTCEYRSDTTHRANEWTLWPFAGSYSNGEWTCSKWTAGNFNYQQRLTLNGNSILTDEASALAATPPICQGATQASATGDPHLQNVYGERFDLMKPGNHVLINIPRGQRADTALLRLEAEAQLLGGLCTDNMYFQKVNITGSWVEATHAGGYVFESGTATSETPKWLTFGKVGVKVVHGHTRTSIRYLNVYVKSLGHTGFPVGGLLGEDDHKEVTTPSPACEREVSLQKSKTMLQNGSEASVASASF